MLGCSVAVYFAGQHQEGRQARFSRRGQPGGGAAALPLLCAKGASRVPGGEGQGRAVPGHDGSGSRQRRTGEPIFFSFFYSRGFVSADDEQVTLELKNGAKTD